MTAPQQWSPELRERALARAEEVGPTKAADELGVPVATVTSWRSRARASAARDRRIAEEQAAVDAGLGVPVNPDDDIDGFLEQAHGHWLRAMALSLRKADELTAAGKGRDARELRVAAGVCWDKARMIAADRPAIVAEVSAVRAHVLARVLVDVLRHLGHDITDEAVAEVVESRLRAALEPEASGLADDVIEEARARALRLTGGGSRDGLRARADELDARAQRRAEDERRLSKFLDREIEELVDQVVEERVATRLSPPGEGSPDDEPDEDEGLVDDEPEEPEAEEEPEPPRPAAVRRTPARRPRPLRAVGAAESDPAIGDGSRRRRIRAGSTMAFGSTGDMREAAEAAGLQPGAPVSAKEVDGFAMEEDDAARLKRFLGRG